MSGGGGGGKRGVGLSAFLVAVVALSLSSLYRLPAHHGPICAHYVCRKSAVVSAPDWFAREAR